MIFLPKTLPLSVKDYVNITRTPFTDMFSNPENLQKQYQEMKNGNVAQWNWAAAILSFFGLSYFWLISRRLYLVALGYICFKTLIISIAGYFQILTVGRLLWIFGLMSVFSSILLGKYGNYLHFCWIQKWKLKYPYYVFPKGGDLKTIVILLQLLAFLIFFPQLQKVISFDMIVLLSPTIAQYVYYERKIERRRL
jgi:hypothetical protein